MSKKDLNKTNEEEKENIVKLNLGKQINILEEEFNTKYKDDDLFMSFLKDYISYTDEYKTKINEKIVSLLQNNYNFFERYFSLFRQILEQQVNSFQDYLKPLNQFFFLKIDSKSKKKELFEQLKSIKFDNDINILNKKQEEYFLQLNKVEDYLTETELGQKIDQNIINSEIQKGEKIEKSYLEYIKEINQKRELFLNEGNFVINELKELNKGIYEKIENVIKTLGSMYSIKLNQEIKIIETINNGMKNVSINTIMNQKEKNLKSFQIDEIKFIPYKLKVFEVLEKEKHLKKKTISMKVCIKLVEQMRKYYKDIALDFDLENEKIKNNILEYAEYFVDSKTNSELPQEKYNKLMEQLENRDNRLFFMLSLNKIRAEGNFEICVSTFKQLGKIMKFILEKIKKENDFEIMRYIIIMCQTYFTLDVANNKLYLIKYIEEDEIFHSKAFWNAYFQQIIDSEIEQLIKTNHSNFQKNENENEQNLKITNLVFTKILSIIHNMLEFRVNKKEIKSFLKEFTIKYNIENEMMEQMNLLVGDDEYKQIEKFDEEKAFSGKIELTDVKINKNIEYITPQNENFIMNEVDEEEEKQINIALNQKY